jgi:hypothetical protein
MRVQFEELGPCADSELEQPLEGLHHLVVDHSGAGGSTTEPLHGMGGGATVVTGPLRVARPPCRRRQRLRTVVLEVQRDHLRPAQVNGKQFLLPITGVKGLKGRFE